MTTLAALIATVTAAYNDASAFPYHDACAALGDYVVSHADDLAERERLERKLVEAYALAPDPWGHKEQAMTLTSKLLIDYVIASAGADA